MAETQRPAKASLVPARFDLIDQDGNRVTNESYAGEYVLVFFGFTHCKMVCPRALAKLSGVLDRLGDRADRVRALYITVDPERDTPEVMKSFLTQNFPRFVGLTGSLEATEFAKKQFRVFAEKNPDPDDPEGYVVPHSAITYVLGPDGEFVMHFTDAVEASAMARALRRLLSDP
jgi:protein SCO1